MCATDSYYEGVETEAAFMRGKLSSEGGPGGALGFPQFCTVFNTLGVACLM